MNNPTTAPKTSHINLTGALTLGFTEAQALTVTGMGHRRMPGCQPNDTIANKLAVGALSVDGARRALNLIDQGAS